MSNNQLFLCDSLRAVRQSIADQSIDLIYLDPPFNSGRIYEARVPGAPGKRCSAPRRAFIDVWRWSKLMELEYASVMERSGHPAADLLRTLRRSLGDGSMTAYLSWMVNRLLELYRVLAPNGALYLHCDWHASHYLKLFLDAIFGAHNLRNEIVWKRQNGHSDAKRKFPIVNDAIFFYAKSARNNFVPQFVKHDRAYLKAAYRHDDGDGRGRYRLSDMASPKGGGMSALDSKTGRPNGWYAWKGYESPVTGWRYCKGRMQQLHDAQRIHYPLNPDGSPAHHKRLALKRYLSEQKGNVITNLWSDIAPLAAGAAEATGYPTQKPLALLERIIRASSNENGIVLDPFCGCGTTLHAAQVLKRRWIGIDAAPLAIKLTRQRLRAAFPGITFEIHKKESHSTEDAGE